jgi:hypothetical protein
VQNNLNDFVQRSQACVIREKGLILDCSTAEIADLIASSEKTGPLCERTGSKSLVISLEKEDEFRTKLSSIGLGMPEI